MATWDVGGKTPSEDAEKAGITNYITELPHGSDEHLSDPANAKQSLHRDLSARQITMIAIGGAIGTGLIIGTGQALANAGPGSVFIAYSMVGIVVYVVMCALGELTTWLPSAGGFAIYATRYVDPALGFALGYTYWFKYIIITPNQLTAAALVIQYWLPADKVNPGVWIAVFMVIIVAINYLGVRFFGEFEFWLSSIKVLTMIGIIILTLVIALGGGPNHTRTGFLYWQNPGAFAEYISTGSWGRFLGVWSCMVNAVFAFLGTELVGVTVGEAENPRRNIPRAIKLTFWRILVFYILAVLFLGMAVPYNSDKLLFALSKGSGNAAASPFVVAIIIAGIDFLPSFLNACILIFVFSASNSDLYIASRTIHGLAIKGQAPAILARTDRRGVPIYSLGLSTAFCCLAFMSVTAGSKVVFGYFVNLVSIFGLLTWISILVSHIYFVKARNAQGVIAENMRYRSPFGLWGSYIALGFCIIVALTKNFSVFTPNPKTYGNFDYKNFITGYIGIPVYLIMIFGYKLIKRTKGVKPEEADLWTGKDIIDADEQMWLEKEANDRANAKEGSTRAQWWYQRTLGVLF